MNGKQPDGRRRTFEALGIVGVDYTVDGEQYVTCPECHAEETFEALGIVGVNHGAQGDQKVKCPSCYHTHTHQVNQRDLSVNAASGVYNCHRCEFRGKVTGGTLAVNVGKGVYFCRQCGFKGSVSRETNARYAAGAHVATKKAPTITPLEPSKVRSMQADAELYDYMASRGISRGTVDRNGVKAAKKSFKKDERGQWEPPRWCVAFCYYHGDQLVNVKYRSLDKDFGQTPGGSPIPYRMNSLDGASFAVVCEGEVDALSFAEVGIESAVSTPHGAIQSDDRAVEGKMKFIELAFEKFDALDRIYLATDADEHGERTAQEFARRFGKERCMVITYPEGCKDANDVLVKYGAAALRKAFEDAEPYPFDGVITLTDTEDPLNELYARGIPRRESIGIAELDKMVGLVPGTLVVVTGIPSHGKSSVVDWIHTNVMVNVGWPVGLFSPENYPAELHTARFVQQLVGKPFFEEENDRMKPHELRQAIDFLRKKLFVVYPDDAFTDERIIAAFDYLVKMYGARSFVVDPWNTLEHQRPPGLSETEYTGRVLNRFRNFARRTDSIVWVVAHPKKIDSHTDTETRMEVTKPPTLYDISGSANFYNICDIGIVVYRERFPSGDDRTHLMVNKVRSKFYGRVGSTELRFHKPSERFYSIGVDYTNMITGLQSGVQTSFTGADWSPDDILEDPF